VIFEPFRAVGRQGLQVVGFRGQDQALEHLPLREVVELAEPGEGGGQRRRQRRGSADDPAPAALDRPSVVLPLSSPLTPPLCKCALLRDIVTK